MMKLAEALILRADCKKRMEQLKARIIRGAKVQEGDQPAEKPQELIAEFERIANELADLIKRINRTNSTTPFRNGETVVDALAERDALVFRRGLYGDLAQAAAVTQERYIRTEVKFVSTVNVGAAQKQADALAKAYRELDARIQEQNWQTELVEAK